MLWKNSTKIILITTSKLINILTYNSKLSEGHLGIGVVVVDPAPVRTSIAAGNIKQHEHRW